MLVVIFVLSAGTSNFCESVHVCMHAFRHVYTYMHTLFHTQVIT